MYCTSVHQKKFIEFLTFNTKIILNSFKYTSFKQTDIPYKCTGTLFVRKEVAQDD